MDQVDLLLAGVGVGTLVGQQAGPVLLGLPLGLGGVDPGDREIPLQVAVMGCVVNGPGEARDADIGIAAGNKRGHLFVRGTNVAVVPEDEMVDALVEWAEFIHEHGVEAAVARVDTQKAEREAEKDRAALLADKGDDANASEQRVELIRKTTS